MTSEENKRYHEAHDKILELHKEARDITPRVIPSPLLCVPQGHALDEEMRHMLLTHCVIEYIVTLLEMAVNEGKIQDPSSFRMTPDSFCIKDIHRADYVAVIHGLIGTGCVSFDSLDSLVCRDAVLSINIDRCRELLKTSPFVRETSTMTANEEDDTIVITAAGSENIGPYSKRN